MKKTLGVLFLLATVNTFILSATYEVGPGKEYEELGSVPWLTLEPGDTVLIYWRSEPYASKIFIRVSGTEEHPIVIKGAPNEAGELPVITGENATTNSQFAGYFSAQWTEDLGLFLIGRNETVPPVDDENYKPSNIIFEYLELTGAYKNNAFTDQFGNARNYNNFCSAIHALISDNLTVRHCKIHDNGQAVFTNSYGGNEGEVSRNTLLEYNEIWNNGGPEDDFTHNVYIQSAGSVIQYNFFGSPRLGSLCANIKDRSSGTIIRYNWIEGAAYLVDLVETEDAQDIIMNEPNYHDVYMYGNILLNDVSSEVFAASLIHFGFDNSPDLAKRGALYFYNNTVFIQGDENDWWNTSVFFIPDDLDPTTTEGKIELFNNIIHKEGTTHLVLMRDGGTLDFYENNWLYEVYEELGYDASAEINYFTDPITGTDPGFIDIIAEDFTLIDSSPCVNISGDLPADIAAEYPLAKEYVKHANSKPRQQIGPAFELGAFENEQTVPVELETFGAELVGKKIELQWQTASENNNLGFYIERSISPVNNADSLTGTYDWSVIGFVKGYGFSVVLQKYSFTDENIGISGIYNYRLKQVDFNGGFEYGEIAKVTISTPIISKLFQNYPNPFSKNSGGNSSTTIKFSIPSSETQNPDKSGQVIASPQTTLKIYDILGKEVATLVNEKLSAGEYEVEFDGRGLPSGIYFYRLQAGKFSATKKMLLVK